MLVSSCFFPFLHAAAFTSTQYTYQLVTLAWLEGRNCPFVFTDLNSNLEFSQVMVIPVFPVIINTDLYQQIRQLVSKDDDGGDGNGSCYFSRLSG